MSLPRASEPGATLQLALSGSISLARCGGVILGEQLLDRKLGEFRVADVADQVGVGEFFRLDHGVQRGGGVERRTSASGNVSMMLSISSAAMPWPLGGSS